MGPLVIGHLAHCLRSLLCTTGLTAFGQGAYISYVSALPPECRDGCSLQMVSANFGWLKGRTKLWQTLNGGRNWKNKALPRQPLPWDHVYIQFLDSDHGWLLMNALQELYETSDGAASWKPNSLPSIDGRVGAAWLLFDMNFAWLGGGIFKPSDSPDGPNYAIKKYDSGRWGVLRPMIFVQEKARGAWKPHELAGCSFTVSQLRIWGQNGGFAIGDGCFYYTEDLGRHWNLGAFRARSGVTTHYPGQGGHPVVFFLDSAHGWLNLDDRSTYRTSDGGRTWDNISTRGLYFEPEEYPDTLQFSNLSCGLGIATDGHLYESFDGGANWRRVETGFRPRRLCIYGGDTAWVLSDGTLYRIILPRHA